MTDAGCNTSFRQHRARMLSSEARREKLSIVLQFPPPKSKPAPLMPFAPGPDCFVLDAHGPVADWEEPS